MGKGYKKIHGVMWIILSQIFLLLSNFLLLKLLATNLNVSDFGYYSLCMTFVLFARQIIYDPFSMVIGKYCSENDTDKKKSTLSLQLVKYSTDKSGILIIISAIVFFIFDIISSGSANLSILVSLCLIYLVANGVQGVYANIFNSIGERKFAALFSIIDSFLKITLAVFFLKFFGNDLFVGLTSISMGSFLALFFVRNLITSNFLEKKFNPREVIKFFRKIFLVCSPLFFSSVLNAFKSIGDRWILAGFMGVDELAAYTVLLQIGYFPVILFFGVAQTYMGPSIYKLCRLQNLDDHQNLKKLVLNILLITIIFGFLSSGLAFVLADWVLDILAGANYKIYAKYLSVFVFAGSLGACAGILQLIMFGVFDTKISSKLIAISIGSGLAAIFILVYFVKFEGAVAGLVIAGLISIIVFNWNIKRKLAGLNH